VITQDRQPIVDEIADGPSVGALPTWTVADRSLLVAIALLALTIGYTLVFAFYLVAPPESVLWVNRDVMVPVIRVQVWVFCLGWLAIAVAAWTLRKRSPDNRWLMYATVQFVFLEATWGSFLLGQHTSVYTGSVLTAVPAGLLLLFDRRPVFLGFFGFIVILVGMSVAQQYGLLPYALLMAGPPIEDGRPALSWVLGIGGMSFVMLFVSVWAVVWVIGRWQVAEAETARASRRLARAMTQLRHYVPERLADAILDGSYALTTRHERRRITVFFSDIVDFSDFCDATEPEDLSRILDEYLGEMATIAETYGGTIDKFVGDGIMIFFGAPIETAEEDHARRAVRMAVAMQDKLTVLREQWTRRGIENPFRVRIGINTGVASVGDWGSKSRTDYTAIGRQVTLAARLEEHCAPDRILISHATWVLVRDEIPCTPRGELQPKGSHRPVKVHEVETSGSVSHSFSGR
jgi:class 3 adenylate cyclase